MNKIHACLICGNRSGLDDHPISMLEGKNMMFTFECEQCNQPGYFDGIHSGPNDVCTMIYDILNNRCWVDGCCEIPIKGCPNFKLSSYINNEVEEYVRSLCD